jgi:hypothetical protein
MVKHSTKDPLLSNTGLYFILFPSPPFNLGSTHWYVLPNSMLLPDLTSLHMPSGNSVSAPHNLSAQTFAFSLLVSSSSSLWAKDFLDHSLPVPQTHAKETVSLLYSHVFSFIYGLFKYIKKLIISNAMGSISWSADESINWCDRKDNLSVSWKLIGLLVLFLLSLKLSLSRQKYDMWKHKYICKNDIYIPLNF